MIAAAPAVMVRLVDEHLEHLGEEVAITRERAAAAKADLVDTPMPAVASLSGPILTATNGAAVLDSLRF
ncbi:hypothetical protein [Glycomyces sp. NPDC047010]|uniref:hypothetical protein n=1 Tax=Glycomyces sp. NPDC047010 TaxID=3155023 RepID=UPI0033FC8162